MAVCWQQVYHVSVHNSEVERCTKLSVCCYTVQMVGMLWSNSVPGADVVWYSFSVYMSDDSEDLQYGLEIVLVEQVLRTDTNASNLKFSG